MHKMGKSYSVWLVWTLVTYTRQVWHELYLCIPLMTKSLVGVSGLRVSPLLT